MLDIGSGLNKGWGKLKGGPVKNKKKKKKKAPFFRKTNIPFLGDPGIQKFYLEQWDGKGKEHATFPAFPYHLPSKRFLEIPILIHFEHLGVPAK